MSGAGLWQKREEAEKTINTDGYDYEIAPVTHELDSKGYFKIGEESENRKNGGIACKGYILCEHYPSYLRKGQGTCDRIIIGENALGVLKHIAKNGMAAEPTHLYFLFKALLAEEEKIRGQGKAIKLKDKTLRKKAELVKKIPEGHKEDANGRVETEIYWNEKKEEQRILCTYSDRKGKCRIRFDGKDALKLMKGIATAKTPDKQSLITSPSYLVHIAEELWLKQQLLNLKDMHPPH